MFSKVNQWLTAFDKPEKTSGKDCDNNKAATETIRSTGESTDEKRQAAAERMDLS